MSHLMSSLVLTNFSCKVNAYSTASKIVFVGLRKYMTSLTVSFSRIITPSASKEIFFHSNKLKVVRIATGWILANSVVYNFVVGDRFNQPCIHNAIHKKRFFRQILNRYSSISMLVFTAKPNPATIFLYGNLIKQQTNGVRS